MSDHLKHIIAELWLFLGCRPNRNRRGYGQLNPGARRSGSLALFTLTTFLLPQVFAELKWNKPIITEGIGPAWAQSSDEASLKIMRRVLDTKEIGENLFEWRGTAKEQELNELLKLMDSRLREAHPEITNSVPVPRVLIIPSGIERRSNAFVAGQVDMTGVPVIWNVEAALADGLKSRQLTELDRLLETQTLSLWPGGVQPSYGGFSGYATATFEDFLGEDYSITTYSQTQLSEILHWTNTEIFDRRKTNCRFSLNTVLFQKPVLLLNEGCEIERGLRDNFYGIESLMNIQIYSTIFIYGESIAEFSEEAVTGVLAHELAHYYLRHGALDKETHRVFYKLGTKSEIGAPSSDPEAERLGPIALSITPPAFDSRTYANSRLGFWPVNILRDVISGMACEEDGADCPDICVEAGSAINGLHGRYGVNDEGAGLTEQERRQHRFGHFGESELEEMEDLVEQCSRRIRIYDGAYKLETPVNMNVNSLKLRLSTGELSYVQACVPEFPKDTKNLWEVISHYKEGLDVAGCNNQKKVFDEILSKGFGLYHTEQEADEFALYLLQISNQSRNALAEFFRQAAIENGDPGCLQWKAEQAKYPFPIVKDFTSSHHDICFREYSVRSLLKNE